ncbi:sensor histidine kinase [Enterococcus sp. HY326]|uniref:sensor histidine kinase n=1 Tax=Enterococcus sp. HY326 TaxID=2971265 RepID=UPI00223EEF4A|nr:sensor histidine kinase [Enterococcus sp. HY326]
MKNRWSKLNLSQYSIKFQLFIIYIPIIFLATLIIGGLLILDSTRQLSQSYQDLAVSDAQRVRSVIFERTSSLKNDVASLSTDTELRSFLSQDYESETAARESLSQYDALTKLKQQDTSISSIRIYTTNLTIPDYQNFAQATTELQASEWFKQATVTPDSFWKTTQTSDGNFSLLTIYKQLPLPLSDYQAVVEIVVDYNFLRNRINNSDYTNQMSLNQDVLFYSDHINDLGTNPFEELKAQSEIINTQFATIGNRENVLLATTTLDLGNQSDQIHIYSMDFNAFGNLRNNIFKWSSVLLLTLLTTAIIIIIFANIFARRIKKLQSAVYHASIEDYQFFQNISGNDEISKISLDFLKIIQHIKQNEEAIFQSQLHEQELLTQQKQMEFSVLSSQINPHFLFNTLETIRMTALKNQDKAAAQSIKLLSKSMRYTLDSQGKRQTTLAEELAATKLYADIQKLRFGDRVNLEINVADNLDTEGIRLLPLLIQPLVENAISHGLEGLTTTGHIQLTITRDANYLIIQVTDNGIGISPERLIEVHKKIAENDLGNAQNIGLRNVNSRIKNYYGAECGLTITSQVGVGTTVTLKIKSTMEH